MGTRKQNADGTAGEYDWKSYKEVDKRVHDTGFGLRRKCGLAKGSMVGIYAKNCPEWVVAMQTCNVFGFVSVALYDTLGAESLVYVTNHAELPVIFASFDRATNLMGLINKCPSVKHMVIIDAYDESHLEGLQGVAKKHGVKLITMAALEQAGERAQESKNSKKYGPEEVSPEDMCIIMYTSGTTGNPKGVMIRHKQLMATMASAYHLVPGIGAQEVYVSYLPLAHILDRALEEIMLGAGAAIGFWSGDALKLVEDLQVLKPTFLPAVPRILQRIYQRINETVNTDGGLKKFLFKRAYKTKSANLVKRKSSGMWDTLVFSKTKERLGGNVRVIVSAGAPLAANVQEFVRVCFSCPVIQVYGLTETVGGATACVPEDTANGEVGPPIPSCEVRLVSVPELNYFAKNNQGEVWIRGPTISSGYYKEPEKTAEDFDKDGWFHTGDIGEFTSRGTLRIIDRKKNIFKLSQGEYVAAEALEQLYAKSPFVSQIWIYGDSFQTTIVSIISVNTATAKDWAAHNDVKQSGTEDLVKTVIAMPAFKEEVLANLAHIAKENKRAGFENVRNVVFVDYEFNTDNDLATPTLKLKRHQLKTQFTAEITAMYKELNENESKAKESAPAAKGKKGAEKTKEADKSDESSTSTSETDESVEKKAEAVSSSDSESSEPKLAKKEEPKKKESKKDMAAAATDDTPKRSSSKKDSMPKKEEAKKKDSKKDLPVVTDEPKKKDSKKDLPVDKDEPKKKDSKKDLPVAKDEPKKKDSKKDLPVVTDEPKKSPSKTNVPKKDSKKDLPANKEHRAEIHVANEHMFKEEKRKSGKKEAEKPKKAEKESKSSSESSSESS
jgi:long-chain acyl-CoA synthetase